MDDSITVMENIIREIVGIKTRKRQKHRVLDGTRQEMFNVPMRKACQEDTTCESKTHMILTVAELETTLDIAFEIPANSYTEVLCDVYPLTCVPTSDG